MTDGSSSTWETSGFRPGHARVLSIAALALDADGNVEHSVVSLLNPRSTRAPPTFTA